MKALILAGGRGKRLNERSANRNKCMLEFAGRPLIDYSLERAAEAGCEEIVAVVGYMAEQIVNHYGNSYRGLRIRYAIQREQRGLVNAIETAAPYLEGADFMLLLADEILLEPNHTAMIEEFRRGGVFALCGVTIPEDPLAVRKTYSILADEQGRILRLVETPRRPVNAFQGTGNILLSHRIFEYIELTPVHAARNEKELPDLIQCAIDDGHIVKSFLAGGTYININTEEDIEIAERALGLAGRAA